MVNLMRKLKRNLARINSRQIADKLHRGEDKEARRIHNEAVVNGG